MRSRIVLRFAFLLCLAATFPLIGCGSGISSTQPAAQPWLPKTGDLRFQGLGAYTYSELYLGTGINGGIRQSGYPNYVGSPLQIGSGVCGPVLEPLDCAWFYSVDGPATFKTAAVYLTGRWIGFDDDVKTILAADTVITSLDIQPAWNIYATARVISSVDGRYSGQHQHVPSTNLTAVVQSLTSSGQIVTALAPDSADGFQVFSYAWGGDTSSKYEATVVTSDIADVGKNFQALAAQGYILTGFGGTRASGMRLVGTRLAGHSESRPSIVSVNGSGLQPDPLKQGFVSVGFVFDDASENPVTQLLQL